MACSHHRAVPCFRFPISSAPSLTMYGELSQNLGVSSLRVILCAQTYDFPIVGDPTSHHDIATPRLHMLFLSGTSLYITFPSLPYFQSYSFTDAVLSWLLQQLERSIGRSNNARLSSNLSPSQPLISSTHRCDQNAMMIRYCAQSFSARHNSTTG